MRLLKTLGYKDWKWNMASLDKDLKMGKITREQAYKSSKKITETFKSGDNNRMLEDVCLKSGKHRMDNYV